MFHGVHLAVPVTWRVYDLSREPATCVRFDRHALYLGVPGARQRCPAHAVGRTEAILLSPWRAGAAALGDALPGTGAIAGRGSGVTVILRSAGLVATATWSTRPGTVAHILGRRAIAAARGPAIRRAAVHAPSARARAPLARAALFTGLGFDNCTTPTTGVMSDWLASPYRAYAIYIGGLNEACAQSNLTATWVTTVIGQGWHLIPTYVGHQGAGSCGGTCATISPRAAAATGTADAADAIGRARALGITPGNPIYDDMEQYSLTAGNRATVLAYLAAWTQELHSAGYLSGIYGSGSSAITDLVHQFGTTFTEPDDLWIGDWNGEQTTSDPYVPASEWADDQRLHQYRGDHNETWGGETLNVDGDAVDGATDGASGTIPDGTFVQVGGARYVYRIIGGAPTLVSSWSAFGGLQSVQTITRAQLNAMPRHPAGGTFVQSTAGGVYRIAGGAALPVSSWSVFGLPQAAEIIDQWDIQNPTSCLAHLLPAPADGTVVEGLPSGTYWSFAGGQRTELAVPLPGAVQVDDGALTAFPLAAQGGSPPSIGPCVATLAPGQSAR